MIWPCLRGSGVRFSKVLKTFRARKAIRKLRPAYSVKPVFLYVVKRIEIKITAKFSAWRRLCFGDGKRIMSPEEFQYFWETGPWSSGWVLRKASSDCCFNSLSWSSLQSSVKSLLTWLLLSFLKHQGVTIGRTQSMEKFHPLSFKFIFFFVLILFQILDMVKPKVEGTVGFLYRQCGICVAQ